MLSIPANFARQKNGIPQIFSIKRVASPFRNFMICAGFCEWADRQFSQSSRRNAVDSSLSLLWSLCSLNICLWPPSNQPLPNYNYNNNTENIILKCCCDPNGQSQCQQVLWLILLQLCGCFCFGLICKRLNPCNSEYKSVICYKTYS